MEYKFKYKRCWLWHTFKVTGHAYDDKQNKLILYFQNGSIREIKKWTNCEIFLGSDWAIVTKKSMEVKVGQVIPTSYI